MAHVKIEIFNAGGPTSRIDLERTRSMDTFTEAVGLAVATFGARAPNVAKELLAAFRASGWLPPEPRPVRVAGMEEHREDGTQL